MICCCLYVDCGSSVQALPDQQLDKTGAIWGGTWHIREAAINAVQYLCISSPHFLGPTIHGGIWAFQGAAEVGSNKLFVAWLLGCSWCSSLHLSPRLILPSSILHLHCHTHSYLLPILSVLPFNLLATACQDVKMDCLSLP